MPYPDGCLRTDKLKLYDVADNFMYSSMHEQISKNASCSQYTPSKDIPGETGVISSSNVSSPGYNDVYQQFKRFLSKSYYYSLGYNPDR